jgi:cytochrome c peroxidase
MGTAQLGANLNPDQVNKIMLFLKSATGVQPKVVYPILPASTQSTPKPKLD